MVRDTTTHRAPFRFEGPIEHAVAHPDPTALLATLGARLGDEDQRHDGRYVDQTSSLASDAQTLTGLATRTDLSHDQYAHLLSLIDMHAHSTISALATNPAFRAHADLVDALLSRLNGDTAWSLAHHLPATDTTWLPAMAAAVHVGLVDFASLEQEFWDRYPAAAVHAAVDLLLTTGDAPVLPTPPVTDSAEDSTTTDPQAGMVVPTVLPGRWRRSLITIRMSASTRERLLHHLCTEAEAVLTSPSIRSQRSRNARRQVLYSALASAALDNYRLFLDRADIADLPADQVERLTRVLTIIDDLIGPFVDPTHAYLPSSELPDPEPMFEPASVVLSMITRATGTVPATYWQHLLSLPRLGNAALRWRHTTDTIARHINPAAIAAHPLALINEPSLIGRPHGWDDDAAATVLDALATAHPHLTQAWDEDKWRSAYRTLAVTGLDGNLTARGWQTLHDHLTDPTTGPAARYGWTESDIARLLTPTRPLEFADRSHQRRAYTHAVWASTSPNPHLRAHAVKEIWSADQIPLALGDPSEIVRRALLDTRFVTTVEKVLADPDRAQDLDPAMVDAHRAIYLGLAQDTSDDTREHLAGRDHTPAEVLHALASDPRDTIREQVAVHPNTAENTLRGLLDDPNPQVVQAVTDRYMNALAVQA